MFHIWLSIFVAAAGVEPDIDGNPTPSPAVTRDDQNVLTLLRRARTEKEVRSAIDQAVATRCRHPEVIEQLRRLSHASSSLEVRDAARWARLTLEVSAAPSSARKPIDERIERIRAWTPKEDVEVFDGNESSPEKVRHEPVTQAKLDQKLAESTTKSTVAPIVAVEHRVQSKILNISERPAPEPKTAAIASNEQAMRTLPPISSDSIRTFSAEKTRGGLIARLKRNRDANSMARRTVDHEPQAVVADMDAPHPSVPTFDASSAAMPLPSLPDAGDASEKERDVQPMAKVATAALPSTTDSITTPAKQEALMEPALANTPVVSPASKTIPRAKAPDTNAATADESKRRIAVVTARKVPVTSEPAPPSAATVGSPTAGPSAIAAPRPVENVAESPIVPAAPMSPPPPASASAVGTAVSPSALEGLPPTVVADEKSSKPSFSLDGLPRDEEGRRRMSRDLLDRGRELVRQGQLDEAESLLVQVRELAVTYRRRQYSPETLEREIAEARMRQSHGR